MGKGQNPSKWLNLTGPFKQGADHSWLYRIDKSLFRGIKNEAVRIKFVDQSGQEKITQSLGSLK